jgi:hypothetical protein
VSGGATGGGGEGGAAGTGSDGVAGAAAGTDAGDVAGASGSAGLPAANDDAGGASPVDGGAEDSFPGMRLPPYDGGIINLVNDSNWNETTIHPFGQRRMLVREFGDPHLSLLDLSQPNPVIWRNVAGRTSADTLSSGSPWARGEQLIGNNQVMGSTPNGYEVFDLSTGHVVRLVGRYPNTQSAYRMANGETMLTRSGTRLSFLDKNDRISHEISYPEYTYVRLARPTRNGTFLVPSDTQVFEGDDTGNVLWKVTAPMGSAWAHVFEPLLLGDGDVLLSTFFGRSLDVIDAKTHLVTKRYNVQTAQDAALIAPNAVAEVQLLPNGNIVTANEFARCGAVCSGKSIIEFSPAGDIVWTFQPDPKVFTSIDGILVLDGLNPQFLHAQEISPDSTWQPVIPTP